ncbi:hypothetical protein PsorP6_014096 [Peronosclerospora sorghi]|uniref:Uncharacterized protein n=1 Tax=Peronosclerospora sorghi TaxID=230839 RepID=A0ACC0VGQ0_9STRA|nr:hypothetical protein PsorP6_014096 [Peronosclerospora sorghi]
MDTVLFLLSLLSLLSRPVLMYVNESSCGHDLTACRNICGIPMRFLFYIHLGKIRAYCELQVFQLVAWGQVVVRDLDSVSSIIITTANASVLTENLAAYKSPQLLRLRTHSLLLIEGYVAVVEYIPSIPSLILPFISILRGEPVVLLDSYAFVRYSLGSIRNVNKESTVDAIDEAREAVCFRKTNPMMYAKARAVARLMIRKKLGSSFEFI